MAEDPWCCSYDRRGETCPACLRSNTGSKNVPVHEILLSDYAAMQADNARLKSVLVDIARQPKVSEIEDKERASIEDGYDMCIEAARTVVREG